MTTKVEDKPNIQPVIDEEPFEQMHKGQEPIEFKPVMLERKTKIKKVQYAPDKIEADFTGNFTYGWVPTDAILVDPFYQRKLQKKKIIKIAHTWDQNKIGVFVVNHRTSVGLYYCIDGQHRHAALQLIDNYPSHVYCQIFQNLSHAQEAQMFHDLDSERDNLTPGASFRALLAAGNPTALGIKTVAEAIGFTVDYYQDGPHSNNLRAYQTLQDIYRRIGADGLSRILSTVHTAWPNKSEGTSYPMLRGLEIFFQKYPFVEQERLTRVLAITTPMYVIATARRLQEDLSSVIYSAVAQTVRGIYNKGLRYKLPEFTS